MEASTLPKTACVASLDRVSVRLGGSLVQESMSFSVGEGEFLAVLGPNGAGKTTLLRLLLGLIQPSSGSISVFGRPPSRGNRQIGYVPQFRALDAGISIRARDMVRLGLDGHRWGPGLPNKRREAAVDEVLDEVGALDLAEAPLGELSGGERQRVLVAQALLSNPRLLLLDEPFASLDLTREAELVGLVTKLCRARKAAILLVTHDVNPMLSEIDGVLFMANGRCAKGPSSEVITSAALSDLYGSRVEVVEALGKLFVVGAPI